MENIIKLKTLLQMQAVEFNFYGKDKGIECPSCKEEQDTAEHILECKQSLVQSYKVNHWNEKE